MKIKRIKIGFMAVLVLMLFGMSSTVMAYSKDDIDHGTDNIEDAPVAVVQTVNGDLPENGGVFTYRITAVTDGAPMPKDGDILTLTGDAYGYFRFDFSGYRAGEVFEYEIRQEKNADENYSWDETVYHVYFQVLRGQDGDLEVSLIISNEDTKDPIVEYTNTYTTPVTAVPQSPITTIVSTKPNTDTGIMGEKGILILAGLVMLAAAGSIVVSERKKRR